MPIGNALVLLRGSLFLRYSLPCLRGRRRCVLHSRRLSRRILRTRFWCLSRRTLRSHRLSRCILHSRRLSRHTLHSCRLSRRTLHPLRLIMLLHYGVLRLVTVVLALKHLLLLHARISSP